VATQEQKDKMIQIASQTNTVFMDVAELAISPRLAGLLPEKLARKYSAIALNDPKGGLTLVMPDPINVEGVEEARLASGLEVTPALGLESDILKAIDKIYGPGSAAAEKSGKSEDFGFVEDDDELDMDNSQLMSHAHEVESGGAPIVKIVDLIMMDSLRKGASDIHIEPFEKRTRVRYRIDGHLIEALTVPQQHHNAVLARLKIMSNLDITENRIPQDGRFKMKTAEKEVDYRVSILPTVWGGKAVLRALDKSNLKVNLNELGFSEGSLQNFKTAIKRPFGMIIVTGPTGSGKSTTLYSILSELNSADKNLITVEDPIEYQVNGISQIQARYEIGMTFARALRAILRQSPDVVMIGEIRDSETADISVKAALTGQIVLSTLHTNDAAGAVVRLRDMNVEPFLIASSLTLVAAQRLARKICEDCKEPSNPSAEELMSIGFDSTVAALIKKPKFCRGKGCPRCGRTGYKGRVAITETLLVTEDIQALIEKGASSVQIKSHAMQNGMLSLRTDALLKYAQGITSLEEVSRVTAADT
jgi:type IV pilus assembly protein PilB